MKIKTKKGGISIDIDVGSFYTKKVTKFGNGAKIDCPKEYIGKDVVVLILKKKSKK